MHCCEVINLFLVKYDMCNSCDKRESISTGSRYSVIMDIDPRKIDDSFLQCTSSRYAPLSSIFSVIDATRLSIHIDALGIPL